MDKKKKRTFLKCVLAIILSLYMICGMVPYTLSVEAHNTADGYPYDVSAGEYKADQWGFYQCECTSFVAYCLNSRNGLDFKNQMYGTKWGNANNWGTVARNNGITVDNNPAVGAVAWSSNGSYGHVAWVCAVNGDNVTLDEYNGSSVQLNGEWHGDHKYNTRTVHKSQYQYIHLKDIPSVPQGSIIPGGSRMISDGDYHIVSALGGGDRYNPGRSCLTIGGLPGTKENQGENALLWPVLGDGAHVFTVTWLGNGYYKIKIKDSNSQCLDVADGSLAQGTNV